MKTVEVYPSPRVLAEDLAEVLISHIQELKKEKDFVTIALSGGTTPEMLFEIMGTRYPDQDIWQNVHLFWVDERCVSADDLESNYGMTRRSLISRINIPIQNIHRIRGEEAPAPEAERYSKEVSDFTFKRVGFPVIDIILLGLGEDGHTASIFPDQMHLLTSQKICEVAHHPATMQSRITITGRVINNAGSIFFVVTGRKKAGVVEKLFKKKILAQNYPAAYIVPEYGQIRWFLDKEAGDLV